MYRRIDFKWCHWLLIALLALPVYISAGIGTALGAAAACFTAVWFGTTQIRKARGEETFVE